MKKLLIVLLFMLLSGLAFAETTIEVKVNDQSVYTVVVADDAVVTVEKTPVPITVVIPVNP